MRATVAVLSIAVLPLALAAQGNPPPRDWSFTLGAGALVLPRYAGSDEYRVFPMPIALVSYRDRVFLGPTSGGLGGGVGARLFRARHLSLTAEVGMMDGRPADRADPLAGTDDRDVLATLGAGLTYALGPVQASVSAAHGLNDESGWLGTARAGYSRPLNRRVMASVEVGATFADARQLRRDFGISGVEAARRQVMIDAGDPRLQPNDGRAFAPGGGVRDAGVSGSLMYFLSPRLALMGLGGMNRLSAEVAASPVVRRRQQAWGGLSLMWRR